MSDVNELRNQIARCRRLAFMSNDAMTIERLLALAAEYEARLASAVPDQRYA